MEGGERETKVFLLCKMRKEGQTNREDKYRYIDKIDHGIKKGWIRGCIYQGNGQSNGVGRSEIRSKDSEKKWRRNAQPRP
jgi:hypothetical protein